MLLKIFFLFSIAIQMSRTIDHQPDPTNKTCEIIIDGGGIRYSHQKIVLTELYNISWTRSRNKITHVVLCDNKSSNDEDAPTILFYGYQFKCKFGEFKKLEGQILKNKSITSENISHNNDVIEKYGLIEETKYFSSNKKKIKLKGDDCSNTSNYYHYFLWPLQQNIENSSPSANQIVFFFKTEPAFKNNVTFESQTTLYTISDEKFKEMKENYEKSIKVHGKKEEEIQQLYLENLNEFEKKIKKKPALTGKGLERRHTIS